MNHHYEQNRQLLQELMEQVGIKDREELSKKAKVSELQLRRIEYGLIDKLTVENLLRIASSLQLGMEQLLAKFTHLEPNQSSAETPSQNGQAALQQKFQQQSIDTIESWLIQWPTAIAAIAKNPDLPAERLIPLVKPVKELVEQWGLTPIGEVGEELPYNPQWHELMSGSADEGAIVKVRYVGYQQQDRILYKAKVSPVNNEQ